MKSIEEFKNNMMRESQRCRNRIGGEKLQYWFTLYTEHSKTVKIVKILRFIREAFRVSVR